MIGAEQCIQEMNVQPNGIAVLGERHAPRIAELITLGLGEWSKLSIYSAKGAEVHFRQLLRESPGNGYYYFGYFQEGSLAGYIEWRIIGESQWFLNNMDVAEQAQGLGIGRKLVEHGLKTARKLCMVSAALDVYLSNSKVLSWYEGFGLVPLNSVYIYEFTPYVATAAPLLSIDNLPDAIVSYEEHGYAMLELSGTQHHTVGLPNAHYFVVRKLEDVFNGSLIGAVLQTFPGRLGLYMSDVELNTPKFKLLEVSVRMEMVL